jgi:hypothetical protein
VLRAAYPSTLPRTDSDTDTVIHHHVNVLRTPQRYRILIQIHHVLRIVRCTLYWHGSESGAVALLGATSAGRLPYRIQIHHVLRIVRCTLYWRGSESGAVALLGATSAGRLPTACSDRRVCRRKSAGCVLWGRGPLLRLSRQHVWQESPCCTCSDAAGS